MKTKKVKPYWESCVEEALEDAGLEATPEQINTITSWVEGAHDNYGQAHGHDMIESPYKSENVRLYKELQIEKEKVHCRECGGRGTQILQGPYHSSETRCWKCHGEGRYTP